MSSNINLILRMKPIGKIAPTLDVNLGSSLIADSQKPRKCGVFYRCGQCVGIVRNKSIYFSKLQAKNKPA